MKILFLTDNFPPEVNAPANRTYEHCLHWVKRGAAMTVITCAPNFPQGKVYEGYRNKLYQVEMMDGIKVIRVWTYISANKGVFKRTLDYVSFAVGAFIASLFVKTDLIVATSPQFFTAVGGFMAAFFKRKPWIMEVRDLWPESIKAVGAMSDGFYIRMMERLELFLYRQANRIVVVTDAFKKNISGRGIAVNKIEVIKNGVRLDDFSFTEKDQALLRSLGLANKFVVSYTGTHGMAHGLHFILDSAKKVRDTDIHFLLIGDGAEKKNLLEHHAKLGLTNVTMLPSVPKKDIKSYISISDLALVNLIKSDTFKTVIPSKIFENAAMKKPIFLGVEGESASIIEEYGAGICFEPEHEADFLEKLHRIKADTAYYRACQEGCTRLAEDFDRNKLAENMFRIFERTLGIKQPNIKLEKIAETQQ
jgi:hypothetical protein